MPSASVEPEFGVGHAGIEDDKIDPLQRSALLHKVFDGVVGVEVQAPELNDCGRVGPFQFGHGIFTLCRASDGQNELG